MPAQLLQILECEGGIEPAKPDKLNMNILYMYNLYIFAQNKSGRISIDEQNYLVLKNCCLQWWTNLWHTKLLMNFILIK